MDQPKIAAIVGCTGSGKSHLAVKLAKQFGGEVVSCDSMQIYRRMDIGTGKVTEEEKEGIAHHLLDIVEPWEPFSCADYVKRAQEVVRNILSRGKVPIFCGGTGLYLDAFLRGTDFAQTEVDTEKRFSGKQRSVTDAKRTSTNVRDRKRCLPKRKKLCIVFRVR